MDALDIQAGRLAARDLGLDPNAVRTEADVAAVIELVVTEDAEFDAADGDLEAQAADWLQTYRWRAGAAPRYVIVGLDGKANWLSR